MPTMESKGKKRRRDASSSSKALGRIMKEMQRYKEVIESSSPADLTTLHEKATQSQKEEKVQEEEKALSPPQEVCCTDTEISELDVKVNRSPVMILWASCQCERILGYDWSSSLSLASALAALNAKAKGRSLGIYSQQRSEASRGEEDPDLLEEIGSFVDKYGNQHSDIVRGIFLLSRETPAVKCGSPKHVQGLQNGKRISALYVDKNLKSAFGDLYGTCYTEMCRLCTAMKRAADSKGKQAYEYYVQFRPDIASGKQGWGQKGSLKLSKIRELSKLEEQRTILNLIPTKGIHSDSLVEQLPEFSSEAIRDALADLQMNLTIYATKEGLFKLL